MKSRLRQGCLALTAAAILVASSDAEATTPTSGRVARPAAVERTLDRPWVRQSQRRSVTVRGDVNPRGTRIPIPRSFLGYSIEYDDTLIKTGVPETGVNNVFVQLLRNITRYGGGPPIIRIGGRSSDVAWWNPELRARPRGVELDLAPVVLDGLNGVSAQTGARYILGLNFAHNDPALAAEWANAARAGLRPGSIETFEVGNEPENLGHRPHGRDEQGRQLTARPPGWDFDAYLQNLRGFVDGFDDVAPGAAFAAPVATCAPVWCQALPALLQQERAAIRRGDMNTVAYHQYPLCRCPGERTPTIPLLLSNEVINTWARGFSFVAAQADDARLPLRITETNSVAGGGAVGVSDVFASALWGLDWMFSLAFVGTDSVHFHSTSDLYSPFSFGFTGDRHFVGKVNPLYYAMLLFARAAPDGARLLPDATFATRPSAPANVRLWATVDRRRTVRILVINKDLRASATMQLEVPGARRGGRLVRLQAPRIDSRSVTLAGQRIPGITSDGRLVGRERTSRVPRRRGGYRFRVPRGSAAMLEIRRVGR